ncbi:MAG TPA: T9SS type A sorting domain-containing protein, partial [Ignavibacteria bacterium]|nr:T9SS type A sorting domain-containing protein [Ignavibacteria bacterium]
ENLTVGTYEYKFNAASLSSGIYFYTLKSDNITETKKMLLVK